MTVVTDIDPGAVTRQRREDFMRRIGGGAALLPSAPVALRNGDVDHEYRQDSDFYYLTGFEEPGSVAVLVPDHPEHRFVMFVQPKDPEREVWTGWRAGEAGAVETYGADAAYTIDKLDEILPKLIQKADRIYYRFGSNPAFDDRVVKLMRWAHRERQRNGTGPAAVVDTLDALHELRLIKTAEQLQLLRKAVNITAEGHISAMKALRPGMFEYEIEAVLRYVFMRGGSRRHGYPPIVASGANATVLHYTSNNRRIEEGDLLLIDAGAEYGYYTGDVTRTVPASGTFSEDQAAIYRVVLDSQLAAIQEVRPGARFADPHDRALGVLVEGMLRLGLLEGEAETIIEEAGYKKFYMHKTSHWLGMDVHDAGAYKAGDQWRLLEPGMALTIEPGLYIPEDCQEVEARYRGIGVRIEDDIVVTENGCEVLSAAVPKTVEEIEGIMMGAHMGE
ncbi:MAG TPA: aminopeptidase P N-terminal domain-containing protein [Blastocatellia bacterium]|nr:aminopeptidase P N-terminal domain-containing protein [Blastocatellia bacterium]